MVKSVNPPNMPRWYHIGNRLVLFAAVVALLLSMADLRSNPVGDTGRRFTTLAIPLAVLLMASTAFTRTLRAQILLVIVSAALILPALYVLMRR